MIRPVTDRTILIVEDDTSLAETLAAYFKARGNRIFHAEDLKKARTLLAEVKFDAVILDMILPDGEGRELLLENDLPPAVILSVLDSEHDILEGFSAGAVDYAIKPCSPELLEARLSLRLLPKSRSTLVMHDLTIDIVDRTVRYKADPITLTGSEFNILWFLMSHAGRFFSATALYEHVWEMPSLKSTSIKYHISNLRRKLKAATGRDLIVTDFGKGYSFLAEQSV